MTSRLAALFCTVTTLATGAMSAAEPTDRVLALAPLFTDHMILQEGMPVPVWGWCHAGDHVTVRFAGQTQTATADPDGRWEVRLAALTTSATGRDVTISRGDDVLTVRDVLVGEVWLCSGQSNMAMRLPKADGGEAAAAAAHDEQLRLFSTEDALPFPMPAEPRTRSFAPRAKPYAWDQANPESAADMSALGWYFAQELRRELKKPIGLILASRGGTVGEAWISRQALAKDPGLAAYLHTTDLWMEDAPAAHRRSIAAQAAWEKACNEAKAKGAALPPKPAQEPALGTTGYAAGCYQNYIAAIHPYAVRGVLWYQGEGNSGPHHGRLYGADYERVLTTLISDWRARWGQEHLPFYIVQLANFTPAMPTPASENGWAEVREVQARVAATIPESGLAVTIDIGDAKDIHPRNKAEVGRRLALVARAQTYGHAVAFSGPVYHAMAVHGTELHLSFDHTEGGLRALGSSLTGFAIAGEDRHWEWADARIDHDTVILSSPKVSHPVAARYAWETGPTASLMNGQGLPASPFRTDTWPTSNALERRTAP